MASNDPLLDLLLARLATKAIKARDEVKGEGRPTAVEFQEGPYVAVGWWDGQIYRIELAKRLPDEIGG